MPKTPSRQSTINAASDSCTERIQKSLQKTTIVDRWTDQTEEQSFPFANTEHRDRSLCFQGRANCVCVPCPRASCVCVPCPRASCVPVLELVCVLFCPRSLVVSGAAIVFWILSIRKKSAQRKSFCKFCDYRSSINNVKVVSEPNKNISIVFLVSCFLKIHIKSPLLYKV